MLNMFNTQPISIFFFVAWNIDLVRKTQDYDTWTLFGCIMNSRFILYKKFSMQIKRLFFLSSLSSLGGFFDTQFKQKNNQQWNKKKLVIQPISSWEPIINTKSSFVHAIESIVMKIQNIYSPEAFSPIDFRLKSKQNDERIRVLHFKILGILCPNRFLLVWNKSRCFVFFIPSFCLSFFILCPNDTKKRITSSPSILWKFSRAHFLNV